MEGKKAAPPPTAAATGDFRTESTSIGEGSAFSKYLGFIGLIVECATAATPCVIKEAP